MHCRYVYSMEPYWSTVMRKRQEFRSGLLEDEIRIKTITEATEFLLL
jgi:hypothetical protein